MISMENLSHRYGNLLALDDISFHVGEGEIFGFIGPNGAGKSTTMKILATLLRPTSGTASVAGYDVCKVPLAVRRAIGYMPDYTGVYEEMTVDEYLRFFAAAADVRGAKAERMIGDVLELTDLTGKRQAGVESLSRGMRQRLGLARVLLHEPQVLLLDEPASGLDPRARVEIRLLLQELRSMGKTILISSHILAELAEICTHVAIIEAGQLHFTGTIPELMTRCRTGQVVRLRVAHPDRDAREAQTKACELLARHPAVATAEPVDEMLLIHLKPEETDASVLPPVLLAENYQLHHFAEAQITLEDAFLHITQGVVK